MKFIISLSDSKIWKIPLLNSSMLLLSSLRWKMQYSESGKVPGITGGIDCNSYDGSEEQLAKEWAE